MIRLIKSFLKIGLIGFGGGSALVPVIEKEVIQKEKIIDEDNFTDFIVVANITPGALPVKLAHGIGEKVLGIKGGLISSFAVALPGTILCIILLSIMSILNEGALKQIDYFSLGISSFIIFLILMYIKKVIADSRKYWFYSQSIIITIIVFVITCGKELRQLISDLINNADIFSKKPIFDLQALDVILLAIFLVIFIGENSNIRKIKGKLVVVALYLILFMLIIGKSQIIAFPFVKELIYLLGVILIFINAIYNNLNKKSRLSCQKSTREDCDESLDILELHKSSVSYSLKEETLGLECVDIKSENLSAQKTLNFEHSNLNHDEILYANVYTDEAPVDFITENLDSAPIDNSISKENGSFKLKLDIKTPVKIVGIYLVLITIFSLLSVFIIVFNNRSIGGASASFISDFVKYIFDISKFVINGILATVTSFGGGESFLTVAQGNFVDNNLITNQVFYKQIVPVANALPGPILVKVLAGIGYVYGFNLGNNSIVAGYIVSLLGMIIGVGLSVIVFSIVLMIYNAFKNLSIFITLKKWILPVVCGLLLSTIVSMMVEMFKTTSEANINTLWGLLIFVLVVLSNFLIHIKYKVNDLLLLLGSGAIYLVILNVFSS